MFVGMGRGVVLNVAIIDRMVTFMSVLTQLMDTDSVHGLSMNSKLKTGHIESRASPSKHV